ncbi:STAS domain-containing protein [Micromonospora purpureochromogenes]|uniref:Anti-anti-sigma factor n=1 Tax=Micromonospora purpureochromogenes TaxID=47872 RepID=A0ABX2RTX1_9ACTN|nr:STAS domain-containing protein [Micromonospora purpureochromogenes]NYF59987.1 anti-anti-sigma factor [Micromonospora purpureochromogenes]
MRVVNATGEIDLETAPALSAALTAAVQHDSWVCCDLSGVTFCCAAGVSVLLEAAHEAARVGHRFHVRGAHGVTARVLHITGAEGFLSDNGSARQTGREGTRPADGSTAPHRGKARDAVTP